MTTSTASKNTAAVAAKAAKPAKAVIGHNGDPTRVLIRKAFIAVWVKADKAHGAGMMATATYCDEMAKTFDSLNWHNTDAGKGELRAIRVAARAINYGGYDKNKQPGNGASSLTARIVAKANANLEAFTRNAAATAATQLATATTEAGRKVAAEAVKVAEAAVKALAPTASKAKGKKEAKPAAPAAVLTPETNALVAAATLKRLLVMPKGDEASVAFSNKARVELSKLGDLIAAFLAASA